MDWDKVKLRNALQLQIVQNVIPDVINDPPADGLSTIAKILAARVQIHLKMSAMDSSGSLL